MREVFANYFVEHFANYENFIIVPAQSYDQWVRNREQFQNFDKTAFLSDQPTNYRPFYSAFVETTMFIGFVDEKIVAYWEPEKAGHNMSLFDSRVDQYRTKSGLPQLPTKPGSRSESELIQFMLLHIYAYKTVHVHTLDRIFFLLSCTCNYM